MTKWYESPTLIVTLVVLFVIPIAWGARFSNRAQASEDPYRMTQALEAIASAQCAISLNYRPHKIPTPQCMKYLLEGKPPQ